MAGIELKNTQSPYTRQLIQQMLAQSQQQQQPRSGAEMLGNMGASALRAMTAKQLMDQEQTKDQTRQEALAGILQDQLSEQGTVSSIAQDGGPLNLSDELSLDIPTREARSDIPHAELAMQLLSDPNTADIGAQIGLSALTAERKKEPMFTNVIERDDGSIVGLNLQTGEKGTFMGPSEKGDDQDIFGVWNQGDQPLDEFTVTNPDGSTTRVPLLTMPRDQALELARKHKGLAITRLPTFQQETPKSETKRGQEVSDKLKNTQEIIGRLGAIREDVRRIPGAFGPTGAAVEFASPLLGMVSSGLADTFSQGVAGGSVADIQNSRTEAKELVTRMVPQIMKEDRFTDQERGFARDIQQSDKFLTSDEQVKAATSGLMAIALGDENYQRLELGMDPLFPPPTTDENINAIGNKLMRQYRMSAQEAEDTLEILEWQWRARGGVNGTNQQP